MDTKGNRLSEYSCSGGKIRGISFDSDDNIIVCFYDSQPEQIKFDRTSRRSLDIDYGNYYFPRNIIFHPEGHKLIMMIFGCSILCPFDRICAFEIKKHHVHTCTCASRDL